MAWDESAAKFIVAKYVVNLSRNEPRNIGVILWRKGMVLMRFAGEVEGKQAKPPRYLQIRDTKNYQRWIDYWRAVFDKPTFKERDGTVVPRDSIRFPEGLAHKLSDGNYQLRLAGEMMTEVTPENMPEVLDFLYGELVAVPKSRRAKAAR